MSTSFFPFHLKILFDISFLFPVSGRIAQITLSLFSRLQSFPLLNLHLQFLSLYLLAPSLAVNIHSPFLMLPNQAHVSDTQEAKHWDAEVCSRERVFSLGSQGRRPENKSQICLPKDKRLGLFMGQRSRVWGMEKDDWRQGKDEVISVLSRHIWVTCFFMGWMFRKWWH